MEQKKINNLSQLVIYILVILGLIGVVNYLSSLVFKRLDLTENKVYSISKATKKILGKLDDVVSIRACFSKDLPAEGQQVEKDVRDMLSEYQAYGGRRLRITWEDPAASEEEKQKVIRDGVPEVQMQSIEKDKVQAVNGFMGIIIQYADKKEVMPVIQERDLGNFEYDLTQAILKVFRKTTPTVAVLKTDTLPSIPEQYRQKNSPEDFQSKYKPIIESLQKNYTVETPEIGKGLEINPQIKTLIVPATAGVHFSDRDLFEIDQYFMNGGNLVLLVEPIGINLSYGAMAVPQASEVERLAEHYGAKVDHNLVLDAACGQVQIPQQVGPFQMNVQVPYPFFVKVIAEGLNKNIPAVAQLTDMILPWTSSISLLVPNMDSAKGGQAGLVRGSVLVKSSKKSWTVGEGTGNFDLNPQQNWAAPQEGFKQSDLMVYLEGNFTSVFAGMPVPPVGPADTSAASAASRGGRRVVADNKNGHVVIAANARFLTSQFGAPGNVTFLQNVVDWLSSGDNLIEVRSRGMIDRSLTKDELKKGSPMTNVIRYTNVLLMPIVVIAIGLFIFLKRREAAAVQPSITEQPMEERK